MKTEYLETLEMVKDLISSKLNIARCEIAEDTRIEEDVSIAGLDTITFYEDFFKQFEIANPQNFDVERYVTSENLMLFRLIKSIFSEAERKKLRVRNTTVRHLTHVAMQKRWFEE